MEALRDINALPQLSPVHKKVEVIEVHHRVGLEPDRRRAFGDPVHDRRVQGVVVVMPERGRSDAQQRRDGRGVHDPVGRRAVQLVHRGNLGPRAPPLGETVNDDL